MVNVTIGLLVTNASRRHCTQIHYQHVICTEFYPLYKLLSSGLKNYSSSVIESSEQMRTWRTEKRAVEAKSPAAGSNQHSTNQHHAMTSPQYTVVLHQQTSRLRDHCLIEPT